MSIENKLEDFEIFKEKLNQVYYLDDIGMQKMILLGQAEYINDNIYSQDIINYQTEFIKAFEFVYKVDMDSTYKINKEE